ncbi:hypothetical protein RCO28_34555 [Streptomyces sp. LHD-70]|uniref:hypothetical protein n=1 Tax=Streptomyces sp. LHD-70 TaxID=3072140 RepID=UPI0028107BB0|nr:hypothetical protein [Streptomyces sp. LHD-70]MDQ8707555.1 hypothetical protein [Streptomyces sp. LHD-70]
MATLHERKARAFALWAQVSGDSSLRREAKRAETAAQTTREMHINRTARASGGNTAGEDRPETQDRPAAEDGLVVERLLTRGQAAHARAVLEYVATNTPCPEPEVRLAVLMLVLRTARAGTGNLTGQDLTGWVQDDAARVLEQLVAEDWLRLPGTVADVMASRPEDPTPITVPTLLPEQPRPFKFGKNNRSRISGWAQKVAGDRKLRKKKAGAATRLLALCTAAHSRPDGCLGSLQDGGLPLDRVAAFCGVSPEHVAEHADLLVTADWLTETVTDQGQLQGQLTERALPLSALL